jgi:hypothetical protein|nr:MAG TPA: hypothetical protein [Crassvirales sp.]
MTAKERQKILTEWAYSKMTSSICKLQRGLYEEYIEEHFEEYNKQILIIEEAGKILEDITESISSYGRQALVKNFKNCLARKIYNKYHLCDINSSILSKIVVAQILEKNDNLDMIEYKNLIDSFSEKVLIEEFNKLNGLQ